jgi:hypothetical protein
MCTEQGEVVTMEVKFIPLYYPETDAFSALNEINTVSYTTQNSEVYIKKKSLSGLQGS